MFLIVENRIRISDFMRSPPEHPSDFGVWEEKIRAKTRSKSKSGGKPPLFYQVTSEYKYIIKRRKHQTKQDFHNLWISMCINIMSKIITPIHNDLRIRYQHCKQAYNQGKRTKNVDLSPTYPQVMHNLWISENIE